MLLHQWIDCTKKQIEFSQNKLIPDIEDNQPYLLQAVAERKATGQNFILDGYFCLLDGTGKVQRISRDTFATLMPKSIILLTEKPRIIAARRRIRDKVGVNEPTNEIYVTVFDKHHSRIFFLGKYSFYCAEKHEWREGVYQRPKKLRFLSSRMKRFLASAFG